jgi:hypothetical protein
MIRFLAPLIGLLAASICGATPSIAGDPRAYAAPTGTNAPSEPGPPEVAGPSVTAQEALAHYDAIVHGAAEEGNARCNTSASDEIMVCAHHSRPAPRLPLPDERAETGEVSHHAGEARSATAAFEGPPSPPSRLMETIGKAAGLLRSVVTGEDPDQP